MESILQPPPAIHYMNESFPYDAHNQNQIRGDKYGWFSCPSSHNVIVRGLLMHS